VAESELPDKAVEPVDTSPEGWRRASVDGPAPFVYNPGMVGAGDDGSPITLEGPLAEGETEGTIAPSPLWAMKITRHFQWSHLLDEKVPRLRVMVGAGDEAVAVIDDGHRHCIVGRHVGSSGDGADYSLVARITVEQYHDLDRRRLSPSDAFLQGKHRALYSVADDGPASNVFLVGNYANGADIPEDFLPGHEPIAFTSDLEEF
jgi:hypothetical protein